MKQILLTRGKVAIVDDVDFERLNQWRWYYGSKGYAVRGIWKNGKMQTVFMHREITNAPTGIETDHWDTNRLNNRRANLRLATTAQNQCNRGANSNNTSGHKGVYWNKQIERWVARIKVGYKSHYLGCFRVLEDAVAKYAEAARKLHGNFARIQ